MACNASDNACNARTMLVTQRGGGYYSIFNESVYLDLDLDLDPDIDLGLDLVFDLDLYIVLYIDLDLDLD